MPSLNPSALTWEKSEPFRLGSAQHRYLMLPSSHLYVAERWGGSSQSLPGSWWQLGWKTDLCVSCLLLRSVCRGLVNCWLSLVIWCGQNSRWRQNGGSFPPLSVPFLPEWFLHCPCLLPYCLHSLLPSHTSATSSCESLLEHMAYKKPESLGQCQHPVPPTRLISRH